MKGTMPVLAALTLVTASSPVPGQVAKGAKHSQIQFRFQPSPTSSFLLNRSPLFGPSLPWSGANPSAIVLPFSHPFRSPGFFLWSGDRWNQGRRFNLAPPQPYTPLFPYSGYGYYWGPTESENNGLKSFIEQWGNRNPFTSKPNSGLAGSSLLSPGMTEEEVTRFLGSPLEKISSGDIQIWKYSGFSLRFEGDRLKGLQ